MKAKFIYEKFEEESDPIQDMGIGIMGVREFDTVEEAAKIFVDNINILTKGRISSPGHLKEIFNQLDINGYAIPDLSPLKFCKNYLDGITFDMPPLIIHELGGRFDKVTQKVQFLKDFREAVRDYIFVGRFKSNKKVNEKFTEDSDPIHDMGIGMLAQIKKYLIANGKKGDILHNRTNANMALDFFQDNTKPEFFKFLIQNPDLFDIEPDDLITSLSIAAIHQNWKFGKLLIKNGVDVNKAIEDVENRGFGTTATRLEILRDNLESIDINEKFSEEESDPIKDMGIGMDHYIYNIKKEEYDSYNFDINTGKLEKLIRKYNAGISPNEIKRFMAFTVQDIYDNINNVYFKENNLKTLDSIIENEIKGESRGWMGMHSDRAMETMRRRSE